MSARIVRLFAPTARREPPTPACMSAFIQELWRTGDPERAGRLAQSVQRAPRFSVEREASEINRRMR